MKNNGKVCFVQETTFVNIHQQPAKESCRLVASYENEILKKKKCLHPPPLTYTADYQQVNRSPCGINPSPAITLRRIATFLTTKEASIDGRETAVNHQEAFFDNGQIVGSQRSSRQK